MESVLPEEWISKFAPKPSKTFCKDRIKVPQTSMVDLFLILND